MERAESVLPVRSRQHMQRGGESRGQAERLFTADLRSRLIAHVAEGCSVAAACRLERISPETVGAWIQQGHRDALDYDKYNCPLTAYAEFYYDIKQAEAQWEAALVKQILEAGKEKKDWRAFKWLLRHRFPERYGRRPRQDNVQPPREVAINIVEVDGEEWQRGSREAMETEFTPS